MRKVKTLGLSTIFSILIAVFSVTASSTALATGAVKCNNHHGKNIVVHLKRHTEDLQATLIAARLADFMQKTERCNVTLFLTLRGARLADMRMPQNIAASRDDTGAPTIAQAVSSFQANGGTVAVCPACAGEIGLTAMDLIPGATILNAEGLARLFVKADKILDF